jgi:putative transposase
MARIGRVVVPGVPHHITQRGVRSQDIFWGDADRTEYIQILKIQAGRYGIKIIGYCLMTNHVHLVAIPEEKGSFGDGIGEAHRLYTRAINFREGVRGHLFQERFFSCPLDQIHTIAALRYVERNPVRAGIVNPHSTNFLMFSLWNKG